MSVFGGDFTRNMSPLQMLISRAVDPFKHEPDYAAHLEVAEYINNKKANTYVSFRLFEYEGCNCSSDEPYPA